MVNIENIVTIRAKGVIVDGAKVLFCKVSVAGIPLMSGIMHGKQSDAGICGRNGYYCHRRRTGQR